MKNRVVTVILLFTYLSVSCNQSSDEADPYENIKKITVTTYQVGEKGFISKLEEYNQAGLMVKKTSLNEEKYSKYNTIKEYTYSDQNNFNTIITYTSKDTIKDIFRYEGNQGIRHTYTLHGELIETCFIEYNEQGSALSSITYHADGSLKARQINAYDEDEALISSLRYNATDSLLKEERFLYDEIGLKYWFIFSSTLHKEEKRINNDPYFLEYEIINYKDDTIEKLYQTYDKKERLIHERNEAPSKNYEIKYTYYKNGLLKEEIWTEDGEAPWLREVYTYEFW